MDLAEQRKKKDQGLTKQRETKKDQHLEEVEEPSSNMDTLSFLFLCELFGRHYAIVDSASRIRDRSRERGWLDERK